MSGCFYGMQVKLEGVQVNVAFVHLAGVAVKWLSSAAAFLLS